MTAIRIGILGAEGKMGRLLSHLIAQDDQFTLVAGFTDPQSPNLNQKINPSFEMDPNNQSNHSVLCDCYLVPSTDIFLPHTLNNIDVLIDFSEAHATIEFASHILKNKIPLVIGTTGLPTEFRSNLHEICKQSNTAAIIAANFSIGMNLMFYLVQQLATFIPNWDVEIIESHHRMKKDAPSGTALQLATMVKEGRDQIVKTHLQIDNTQEKQNRKSENQTIDIHSIRAGKIIGDHQIWFVEDNELLQLRHQVQNRIVFAKGALWAAQYVYYKAKNGKLYTMNDIMEQNFRKRGEEK